MAPTGCRRRGTPGTPTVGRIPAPAEQLGFPPAAGHLPATSDAGRRYVPAHRGVPSEELEVSQPGTGPPPSGRDPGANQLAAGHRWAASTLGHPVTLLEGAGVVIPGLLAGPAVRARTVRQHEHGPHRPATATTARPIPRNTSGDREYAQPRRPIRHRTSLPTNSPIPCRPSTRPVTTTAASAGPSRPGSWVGQPTPGRTVCPATSDGPTTPRTARRPAPRTTAAGDAGRIPRPRSWPSRRQAPGPDLRGGAAVEVPAAVSVSSISRWRRNARPTRPKLLMPTSTLMSKAPMARPAADGGGKVKALGRPPGAVGEVASAAETYSQARRATGGRAGPKVTSGARKQNLPRSAPGPPAPATVVRRSDRPYPRRRPTALYPWTRIFTAVSLWSISVVRPSETRSSRAMRRVMNGVRSTTPSRTSLMTASWSRT